LSVLLPALHTTIALTVYPQQGVMPPMTALRNVNDDAKRYTMTLIYKKRIIETAVSVVAVADNPTKLTVRYLLTSYTPRSVVGVGHLLEARRLSW
jgi:hypothetical protein